METETETEKKAVGRPARERASTDVSALLQKFTFSASTNPARSLPPSLPPSLSPVPSFSLSLSQHHATPSGSNWNKQLQQEPNDSLQQWGGFEQLRTTVGAL